MFVLSPSRHHDLDSRFHIFVTHQRVFFHVMELINIMDSCIFCAIIEGDIPSHSVYEDETTLAFLDINPISVGHTLIIPKYHSSKINQLPVSFATSLMQTVHTLTGPIEKAVGANATTIAFNNGSEAGQEVPHVHCHIIPRFEQDGGKSVHSLVEDPPSPPLDFSDIVMSIKNLI